MGKLFGGESTGVGLIATERSRQTSVEGWTPSHDSTHTEGELARAAQAYVSAEVGVLSSLRFHVDGGPKMAARPKWTDDERAGLLDHIAEYGRDQLGSHFGRNPDGSVKMPDGWPFGQDWWKPSNDPIRNLVKAGALIAAEIDRLHRINKQPVSET